MGRRNFTARHMRGAWVEAREPTAGVVDDCYFFEDKDLCTSRWSCRGMAIRSARDSRFERRCPKGRNAVPNLDAANAPRRDMNLLIESESALELEQHVQE